MTLRQKIFITLLPFLLPVIFIIYANYQGQKEAEINYYLRMAALTVSNGAKDLNDYLRFKNSTFHQIVDDLSLNLAKNRETTQQLDRYISMLLTRNGGFSMLLFTDTKGKITFFKTAINDVSKFLWPRDITGFKALSDTMLNQLASSFTTWSSNKKEYFKQSLDIEDFLLKLTVNGEKNSIRYRQAQEKLLLTKHLSSHPPFIVFDGGQNLAAAAALPFRDKTYIFAIPNIDNNDNLLGYIAGILDWSVIEDKCYQVRSEVKFGGIQDAIVKIQSRDDTFNSSANDRVISLELEDSNSNIFQVIYDEQQKAYLVSSPIVNTQTLNAYNHVTFLDAPQSNLLDDFVSDDKVTAQLCAYIPASNIHQYAQRLYNRAVLFLLTTVVILIAVIFYLSDRIVRPISRVAKAAERISQGNFKEKIDFKQGDEIGNLVQSFNRMCDSIAKSHNELHEKNEELQLEKNRYYLLFHYAPIPITVSNITGNIIEANETAIRLSGYDFEDLKNLTSEKFYKNARDRKLLLEDLKKNKVSINREFDLVNRKGDVVACRGSAAVLEINKEIYIFSIFEDITSQKKIEQEKALVEEKLHRAKRMEAIGVMAGGIAHDLNNILAGLVGYPDLLLEELPKDSDMRKPLEAILESGNRASAIVADLLTVAKGVATKREITNLHSIIASYLKSPEFEKLKLIHPEVRYISHLQATQPQILCSPVHIGKCLMNLVMNAAEAINGEGEIRIYTTNKKVDSTTHDHNLPPGDYIVLSIHDTGSGIVQQDLEHIFEPFYSKKMLGRSGTGLGLTVVWNTVQEHGGKIIAESTDQGTTFQLFFPVTSEQEIVATKQDDVKAYIGKGERILVVDDEPFLLDLASRMLQSLGYNVATVSSGELAIEFVKNNPVDLLVLDMLMEPGINGRQAYEQIIKLYPGQKAIIASGYSANDNVKQTLSLGAGGFIKKPFSKRQLGRAVKEALTAYNEERPVQSKTFI